MVRQVPVPAEIAAFLSDCRLILERRIFSGMEEYASRLGKLTGGYVLPGSADFASGVWTTPGKGVRQWL